MVKVIGFDCKLTFITWVITTRGANDTLLPVSYSSSFQEKFELNSLMVESCLASGSQASQVQAS